MAFTIAGKIVARGGCRIPRYYLNAVDAATARVLAFAEIPEGTESEFKLEYDRSKLDLPNEPHKVLLIATRNALKGARVDIAKATQVGEGFGIEDNVNAAEWVKEGDNYVILDRYIYVDCCCILWALFGVYTVMGTVLDDPLGIPLPGVTVEAQDWDPGIPDYLGSDVTDAAGQFRIQVPYATFVNEDAPLNRPDLRFRVTKPGVSKEPCACLDFDEDIIRFDWPNCKPVTLRVPCCLAIIERVGGWDAHFDASIPSPSPHAPPPPPGRGIDSITARAQGYNATGSPGQIAEDSVFGGRVTLCGAKTCPHGSKYRFSVARWADESTPPTLTDYVPITTPFSEMVYGGLICHFDPIYGFICEIVKNSVNQAPPTSGPDAGFYDVLSNTESGCLMAPWNSNTAAFPDGKYSILLTIRDEGGCEYNSSPVTIRIDNTPPKIELTVSVEDCATIKVGDIVTGTLTAKDDNFHSYRLVYEGDGVSGVIAERIYTGVGDTGDVDVAWSWDTSGLPPCGYRLVLHAWDRAIVNDVRAEGEVGFGHRVPIVKYYCLSA